MATIRIPVASQRIETPDPRAGSVGVRLAPSFRDPRAGQMDVNAGQRQVADGTRSVENAAGIGRAALQIGTKLDQLAEAENRMADDTAVRQARTSYLSRLGEVETEFHGRDIRSSAEARGEFDRRGGEIRDELGRDMSPNARRQWGLVADELLVTRSISVGRDAFSRGAQAAVATLQDSTRDLANRAAAARTPEERAVLLQQGQQEIASAVANGYMNPEAAGRMSRGFRQDVQMADINRLMGTSPGAAIALLNDHARTPDIEADRRQSLINAALTRQDAMAARAEAAANRREIVATRALAEWDNLAATGIVPAERAERTLALARGTAAEPIVRQRIADAATVERFRVAPPAQQQELLREAETRARGPNASDRDLQHAQRLIQTADQQRRGYAQDGWMQGVRDQLIDRNEIPPPLNLADPSTIEARLALSDRLSAPGRQVPILSGAEAVELSRQFLSAQGNPEQLSQLIGALRTLPPRAREATVRQLENTEGPGGKMERGSLNMIIGLANGSPTQQRAAVQVTQAITGDRSERVRGAGERAALDTALRDADASPAMSAWRAAAGVGPAQREAYNARIAAVRELADELMMQGTEPAEAVRRAQGTVFADQASIHRPGLAQVHFDRSLNLGPADQVERAFRGLRDRFVAAIPLGPDARPSGAPSGPAPGRIEAGNIDLDNRPRVRNADGSVSTVRTIGVNIDGREVLLPTVSDDGRILTERQAVDVYRQTGRHLGMFDTPENATAYAQRLHEAQEARFVRGPERSAELNQRNRDLARIAGQAEWRTVGEGRFALVGRGDHGQQVILQEVTADQLRGTATTIQRRRDAEAAPRPPGQQRSGRMVPTPTDDFRDPPTTGAPPALQ